MGYYKLYNKQEQYSSKLSTDFNFTRSYLIRYNLNKNMERPKFTNNEIYHICNRGVDNRNIFLDDDDYFRFVHNLFEFNDIEPALNLYYKSYEIRSHKIENPNPMILKREKIVRKLLVKILAFCLMPNHFHLLLEQKQENGISEFLRKLGIGYAMYFNQKYKRVGTLFQGRFKAVLVKQDAHFIHLPYYIHSNSLDLKFPEWRNKEIKYYKGTIKFLENYRWSSFLDYIGKKNFPSVTQREFLLDFFGGPEQYKKDTIKWLKEMDLEEIKDLILE